MSQSPSRSSTAGWHWIFTDLSAFDLGLFSRLSPAPSSAWADYMVAPFPTFLLSPPHWHRSMHFIFQFSVLLMKKCELEIGRLQERKKLEIKASETRWSDLGWWLFKAKPPERVDWPRPRSIFLFLSSRRLEVVCVAVYLLSSASRSRPPTNSNGRGKWALGGGVNSGKSACFTLTRGEGGERRRRPTHNNSFRP